MNVRLRTISFIIFYILGFFVGFFGGGGQATISLDNGLKILLLKHELVHVLTYIKYKKTGEFLFRSLYNHCIF